MKLSHPDSNGYSLLQTNSDCKVIFFNHIATTPVSHLTSSQVFHYSEEN